MTTPNRKVLKLIFEKHLMALMVPTGQKDTFSVSRFYMMKVLLDVFMSFFASSFYSVFFLIKSFFVHIVPTG